MVINMTTAQKLKVIQTLSGLSQEKLAQKFSVSFATLNSWINAKSIPRKKAQQQIEEMYLDITGQKIIPADELAAKKQIVKKKQQEHHDVLKVILENPDIHDQYILSLTYHTNRIEGSTLTEPETGAILFHDSTIPDKSLIEHLEVKNHQTALQYLFNHMASGSGQIDETLILNLHRMLMNSIRPDAGNYRQHSVRIAGADVPTANYIKVPFLIAELIEAINAAAHDTISHIAEIHSRFEQIHPFSDGNGRIGRLLIHAMALPRNLPPAVIRQEKKRFYYSYLNKAQQTQNKDLNLLEDFICDALLEGFQILERE
jgi:Fic family protein